MKKTHLYDNHNRINFVNEYLSIINAYIERYEEDLATEIFKNIDKINNNQKNSSKIKKEIRDKNYNILIENIDAVRKNTVFELLEKHHLQKDFFEKIENNNKIKEKIKVDIKNFYNLSETDKKFRSDLFNIFFSKNKKIYFETLKKYKQHIDEYRLEKNIDVLYNFTFLKDKENIYNKKNKKIKETLYHLVKDLDLKDKAEYLSTLNVFFEFYSQTPYGKKHLEILENKFKKEYERDPDKASSNWVYSIMNTVSESSLMPICKEIDADNLILNVKTNGSGLFDSFLLLNNSEYSDEELKELENIQTEEELFKFKYKYEKFSNLQMCSTADKGLSIEGDSPFRHGLSNIYLTKIMNEAVKDSDWSEAFIQQRNNNKSNNNFNGNPVLRGLIIDAYKKANPDFKSNVSQKDENYNIKSFNEIVRNITSSPFTHLEKIGYKLNNGECDLKTMEKMINDNNNPKNKEKLHFIGKSILSLYRESNPHRHRRIHNENNKKYSNISKLSKESKEIMIHFSGLMKKDYVLNEGTPILLKDKSEECFANNYLELRYFFDKPNSNKKINNEITTVNNLDIEDIDAYLIDTFLINDMSKKNRIFFNKDLGESFSEIILSKYADILEGKSDLFFEKYEIDEKAFIEQVEYLIDQKDILINKNLSRFIDKRNNRIEKELKEKAIEQKEKAELKNQILELGFKKMSMDGQGNEKQLRFNELLDSIEFDKQDFFNEEKIEKLMKNEELLKILRTKSNPETELKKEENIRKNKI